MKKAFTAVMKEYFGLLPGENIMGFSAELKKLSYQEKLEFHAMLEAGGVACLEPNKPAGPAC